VLLPIDLDIMQTMIVAIVSVLAFLIVITLAGVGAVLYLDIRNRNAKQIEAMSRLTTAIESLLAIEKMPEYLAGIERVCGSFVIEVSKLEQSVERFHSSMFRPENEGERRAERQAFVAYDDTKADEAWEIEQMVQNGMNYQQAREKVQASRASRFTLG